MLVSLNLRRQRRLSMVELMVGITIGLIIVAAASMMMVNQIKEHRALTLETQIQQDLRAATDLMLRDLRRAGFWAAPEGQVWAPGQAATGSNPYASTAGCSAQNSDKQVVYAFSKATYGPATQQSVAQGSEVADNEYFGFRRSDKTIDFMLGCANGKPNWQPLTDENTLVVKDFSITPVVQTLSLADFCSKPCADEQSCPRQEIRRYEIVLTVQAAFDNKVERTLRVSSRQRNDQILGACPT